MGENQLITKLEGLYHKFEEVSTFITDPAVIADMKRFVKLNKEYHELAIVNAGKRYKKLLANLSEAKELLDTEILKKSVLWLKLRLMKLSHK